ncbi:LuxR C-terminal-related transcriptional regulator [Williamsia sp. 1138]|uniref:LuxR C-terminal-related transcriptional regulator n=1 Tax=Williamsia sp. 1138 TaxID=1903117 RepID=UPI001180073A|nr:LuxR C-terminal-related transcriptional regulator [Williamsia sp. 1138]
MPVSSAGLRSASSPQALLARLQAGEPTVAFVTGVSGSGKTELLESCRSVLNRAGTTVSSTPDKSKAAIILDDAHSHDPETLSRIARYAESPQATVIVASEPRFHDPAVKDLRRSIGAFGSAFTLTPLSRAEIVARAGGIISPVVAESIRVESGGIRAAVNAALVAARSAADGSREPEALAHEAISQWQQRRLMELDPTTLDVLTIAGLHPTPDPNTIAETLGIDDESACSALDRARGSGFLGATDVLLTSAATTLRVVRGDHVVASIHRALVDVLLAHGVLREDTAITAAHSGITTPALAQMLSDAAALAPAPRAVTLWTAALAAGADPGVAHLPLADAAVQAGDLDAATALVDTVLADGSPAARRDAVRIAASVAARRGSYSRCAALYRWLGPEHAGGDAPLGVLALIATGDRAGAEEFTAAAAGAPPTTENSRALLLSTGLVTSLTTSRAAAIGSVLRSASLSRPHDRAEPESATAIAALLALHGGDLVGARSAHTRSALARSATSTVTREKLLFGWTLMLGGDLDAAAEAVRSCEPKQFRDLVVARALAVAIARRRGDAGGLLNAWRDAAPVVAEMEVDLFNLLPVGELWLTAVRLGETARLTHLVDDADRLLGELGSPPAWATSWSWYGVQAAILSDDPAALVPYARMLGQAAGDDAFAAALADAGRAWLRVMQGNPDVAEVESAARKLETAGLSWDAARLAGEAALRVEDTQSATTLLQVARLVSGSSGPGAPAPASGPTDQTTVSQLSEREAEVARHLLLGHTYREIGAALYISAKTVEHHVARIRRRIGAGSRSEMLSMLRAAGYGPAGPE